jgi:hypothetical protein
VVGRRMWLISGGLVMVELMVMSDEWLCGVW